MSNKNRNARRIQELAEKRQKKQERIKKPKGKSSYALKRKQHDPFDWLDDLQHPIHDHPAPFQAKSPPPVSLNRPMVSRVRLPNSGKETLVVISRGVTTFLR